MVDNEKQKKNFHLRLEGENEELLDELTQIEDPAEFSVILRKIFQDGILNGRIEDLVDIFHFLSDKVEFFVETVVLTLQQILEERTCLIFRWSVTLELLSTLLNLNHKTEEGSIQWVDNRGKMMKFIAKFILQAASRITFLS